MAENVFDNWADQYDAWFKTPSGRLVKAYESQLLLKLLTPGTGDRILDAGCGTGIFTRDVLERGACITGIDRSLPMLTGSAGLTDPGFHRAGADMTALPFKDNAFDRTFSVTAVEFIRDAALAAAELNRVTRPGGCIVLTTLNRMSPWAERRKKMGEQGHPIFRNVFFRSPEEMKALIPASEVVIETAVHFEKQTPVTQIPEIEASGRDRKSLTGAFLAVQWKKS